MLYPSEIALFVALGVLFAAGLAGFAIWSKKDAARLCAYALIAVAFLYVGFAAGAKDPSLWVGFEMTGVALFASLAAMSIIARPWLVVVGLLGHAAWTLNFHYFGTGSEFMSPPLPLATAGFDVAAALLAAYAVWRQAQDKKNAPAPEPAHKMAARSQNRIKGDNQ